MNGKSFQGSCIWMLKDRWPRGWHFCFRNTGKYLVKVHIIRPSGYVPMKLLKEILRQESEQGIFGRADSVARVSLGDLCPFLVAHTVVGEDHPLLCQVVALPLLLSGQQWCGFWWRLGETISDSPLPSVPRWVHWESHFWQKTMVWKQTHEVVMVRRKYVVYRLTHLYTYPTKVDSRIWGK